MKHRAKMTKPCSCCNAWPVFEGLTDATKAFKSCGLESNENVKAPES